MPKKALSGTLTGPPDKGVTFTTSPPEPYTETLKEIAFTQTLCTSTVQHPSFL